MYEKDKERYEKEMKKYSSDKIPKAPPAKKTRTKTPKEKTATSSSTKTVSTDSKSLPDERSAG